MKFSVKDFFSKCDQIRSSLRIWPHFTEEIVNGKLHFLCSASFVKYSLVILLTTNPSNSKFCNINIGKGVLRNFAKFTGKHMRQSLFFNKVASLSLRFLTLLKKKLWRWCFPVNFAKFL